MQEFIYEVKYLTNGFLCLSLLFFPANTSHNLSAHFYKENKLYWRLFTNKIKRTEDSLLWLDPIRKLFSVSDIWHQSSAGFCYYEFYTWNPTIIHFIYLRYHKT